MLDECMSCNPETAALFAAGAERNSSAVAAVAALQPADGGLGLVTAELMALGGDARITLDEQSGLNSYGCAPKPMPAISYASSTASTVSSGAYAQARAFHFQLQEQAQAKPVAQVYAKAMEAARGRLRRLYGLGAAIDVAFGPSGTDLEYLVLAIAMSGGRRVRNFVVEVDEVGSGCLDAQRGRYFAPKTALGLTVEIGSPVPGFDPGRVEVETVPVRGANGRLADAAEREALLARAVSGAIAAGERPLLHVVHRSKTGLIVPLPAALARLAERFGDALDVVVDACQGRISPALVRSYLDMGATVFVTGSKFIGGPPFSAFALVPERLAARMREAERAPDGLGGFFARGEMPADWAAMEGVLAPITNFGLLLRLECGLFELGRLLAYPDEVVADAISAFAEAVHTLPEESPFALLGAAGDADGSDLPPLDRTMLHTLLLTDPHPETGKPLDIHDAKALYASLYTDVSGAFADPRDSKIAAEICHVGQPVRCLRLEDGRWAATLRLSLSAPQISQLAGLDRAELLRRFRTDIAWIGAKARLALSLLPAKATAA
jgi:hypothetical protein